MMRESMQMLWPNAQAILAQMIDCMILGYWTNKQFMADPVSICVSLLDPNLPIAIAALRSSPNPTIVVLI
jgi:hypothetical protein